MRHIAKQAGVAVTTVSSALHDTGRVSPDVKQRIHDIADQMGYRPKLAARLLRASRTGRLALIMIVGQGRNPSTLSQSGSHGPIIAEFAFACSRMKIGFEIEYLETGNNTIAPSCFTSGQVDGALVCGKLQDPTMAKWFSDNDKKFPCVYLDQSGEYNTWQDTESGIYHAMQHIAAMGHRKVGFLGVDSNYHVHQAGIDAFDRAVKDFKLDDANGQWRLFIRKEDAHVRSQWIDHQLINARKLLQSMDRPTAVMTQGVPDARCMVHAAMELGLRIPDDLSIVTYGMPDDAEKSPPRLHCVEPDFAAMVPAAINMLRARLAGETIVEKSLKIMPQFTERCSVAVCTK
jgi:LacI family transcriptional regulator